MKKIWWSCPVCGQKLLMIDAGKNIEGVYIMCRKCHQEVEIINEPEREREPTVRKAV